jgi:ATP-binding cassette subfamily F protein 3
VPATKDAAEHTAASRKLQRQEEAKKRERLKPLYDRVRKIEQGLSSCRKQLESIENILAGTAIYSDIKRKDELRDLLVKQAEQKAQIETLEGEWLEASENLELAE